jgi:hypothetical protein
MISSSRHFMKIFSLLRRSLKKEYLKEENLVNLYIKALFKGVSHHLTSKYDSNLQKKVYKKINNLLARISTEIITKFYENGTSKVKNIIVYILIQRK